MWLRYLIAPSLLAFILGLAASCSGAVSPTLGARLIFEEQLTDNLKAQIILADTDLLGKDDEEEYTY